MIARFFVPLFVLSLISCATKPISAQVTEFEQQRLLASDRDFGDQFGRGVAIEGNLVLVGAEWVDIPGAADAGAAYVFRLSEGKWLQEEKLSPDSLRGNHRFGSSVDINEQRLLIGADFAHGETAGNREGAAFVFEPEDSEWDQSARLWADDGKNGDGFGGSVAMSGNRILIGAEWVEYPDFDDAGAAYMFEQQDGTWDQVAKFSASQMTIDGHFGNAVDMDGNRAVVGSMFGDSGAEERTGAAYVFERIDGVWTETATLYPSDVEEYDYFGASVSLNGDRILVGSERDDERGEDAGAAYVFDLVDGEWREMGKLMASDGTDLDILGGDVAVWGDRAVVGTGFADANEEDNVGAAYLFEFVDSQWVQSAKLTAADAMAGAHFGQFLDMDSQRAVFGAFLHDVDRINTGAAYVVTIPEPDSTLILFPCMLGLTFRVRRRDELLADSIQIFPFEKMR